MSDDTRQRSLSDRADDPRLNVIAALLFMLAMLSPYLLKGTNASLTVNDGLEQLDRFGVIRDGRPLVSSWYLPQFLTHQLGIFWGLVVNDVLCRLVAFAGTWLLLRRLSIGLRPPLLIVTLLACAFSALEFWPQSDLSVAGVPIALLALLKLRERQHPLLWCGVFVLFAYHSHFALAGVPLLLAMLGVSCWEFIRGNRHTYLPLGILTLSATYAAKSWLTTDFPTMSPLVSTAHLIPDPGDAIDETVSRILRLFSESVYLARANHASVILPTGIACIGYLIGKKDRRSVTTVSAIALFALFACIWFALQFSRYWHPALAPTIAWLSQARWYFLLPSLWYVAWGMLLANVVACSTHRERALTVSVALIAIQIISNASETSIPRMFARPSFSEFVAEDLFARVRRHIKLGANEQVGCVGFHPAAARYNEIPTIDSSTPSSLSQRQTLRRIIAVTLARRPSITEYLERPDARLYLFDDEIGTNVTDQRKLLRRRNDITPNYDVEALKEARVKYLLSTLPFREHETAGYKLVFRGSSSYYQMFVYQVY